MSDLMREEFSKWLMDVYGLESEWQEERNCFKDFTAHLAYQAWQASRERLVIELPKTKEIMPLSLGMYVHEIRKIVDENKYTRAIDLARCAIHAAGVKTK